MNALHDTPVRPVLERLRRAPSIVDVLNIADALAGAVALSADKDTVRLLAQAVDDTSDEPTAIAAVHALGRAFDDDADAVLSDLLSHPRAFVREHAAWALNSRLPRLDAIGRLVALVTAGGFSGVLAQRTLETWSSAAAEHVALAVEGALASAQGPTVRARLVEMLGLVPGPIAGRALRHVADSDDEPDVVRMAAVDALGDRTGDQAATSIVARLSSGSGPLAETARLAMADLDPPAPSPGEGLTVAQLFLHADLDHQLTWTGKGDNGGIATLLVRLGDALERLPDVRRVLTLSRGSLADAVAAATVPPRAGHHLLGVPMPADARDVAGAWSARVTVRRNLRRLLRRGSPVDVLHLRMADVGTLVAAEVANELDIPVVFTLAPDPHALIRALERDGGLTRANFGDADEREHFWYRAKLVRDLAQRADRVVVLPRPSLRAALQDLLGLDVDDDPRCTVVPEGIDLSVTDAARAAAAGAATPALAELEALVAALPPERRGLPLAVSVGRLHRVKDMPAVVAAWAGDADLRARCNLLVVGGDLADPSPEERRELDRVTAAMRDLRPADGLILAGHRPHTVVACWLAAARTGRPGLVAPGGTYVSGSVKEEFGLAILEALAAGLPVVAKASGGPATYIDDGVTGVLVDDTGPHTLARAMHATLDLAASADADERAERAYRMVREHFAVQSMAASLAEVYQAAVHRGQVMA
ncbi:glycosyltransferase [Dactylosporangium aurantiacum]|uniref:Glycosyltransferase n=1 Tax=Dactylosporangium aurantiacum TaxID=35754 RepID=A0A9Q9MRT6_9ACTN|nr:glycosyltransferase [Dactylosporangium aurantiacum]MDG6103997.1 glycosyltransferase [Dactylosporangium aurantiacum]UWZ58827.1 glycosyltransferase [Dactylosporangium aurantiacum]